MGFRRCVKPASRHDQLIFVDGKAINEVKLLEAYLKEKIRIISRNFETFKDRYQSGSTFKLVELKVDKIKILSGRTSR